MIAKKEFIIKYNICAFLAGSAFNKLGLMAKKFTNIYKNQFIDLTDEEYFLRAEFGEKNDGVLKKDEKGNIVVTTENEKKLFERLNSWKKEPIDFELNNHKIYIPELPKDNNLFMIEPSIYEELNGVLFDLNEEDYLEIVSSYLDKE